MSEPCEILRQWFGLGPAAGRLIATLYAAQGAPVSFDGLVAAVRQTRNGTALSLKRARAAMDAGSIETSRKAGGYWLTAVGVADCERALADAASRERAA